MRHVVERSHEQSGVEKERAMFLDEDRHAESHALFPITISFPNRRLRNARPNIDNEQPGQRAGHKKSTPPKYRKHNPIDESGQQITKGIALLQNSRKQAARRRGQRLHRERSAESPFAAHPDAKERAQNQEDSEIRRKGGEQFNH